MCRSQAPIETEWLFFFFVSYFSLFPLCQNNCILDMNVAQTSIKVAAKNWKTMKKKTQILADWEWGVHSNGLGSCPQWPPLGWLGGAAAGLEGTGVRQRQAKLILHNKTLSSEFSGEVFQLSLSPLLRGQWRKCLFLFQNITWLSLVYLVCLIMVARCCASPPGVYILLPGISSLLEDSVVLIHATNEFVFFPIFLKYAKKKILIWFVHIMDQWPMCLSSTVFSI